MSTGGIFDRVGEQLERRERSEAPPTMSDLLDLPDEQRALVRHVLRADQQLTPAAAAAGLGWAEEQLGRVLGDLSLVGILELVDGHIAVSPMQRTTRTTPGGLWGTLGDL